MTSRAAHLIYYDFSRVFLSDDFDMVLYVEQQIIKYVRVSKTTRQRKRMDTLLNTAVNNFIAEINNLSRLF